MFLILLNLIKFVDCQDRDSREIDQNMLVPPNLSGQMTSGSPLGSTGSQRRHRRLSSLNTVSWPNPNELTVSPRPRRMSTVTSTDLAPQVINLT